MASVVYYQLKTIIDKESRLSNEQKEVFLQTLDTMNIAWQLRFYSILAQNPDFIHSIGKMVEAEQKALEEQNMEKLEEIFDRELRVLEKLSKKEGN